MPRSFLITNRRYNTYKAAEREGVDQDAGSGKENDLPTWKTLEVPDWKSPETTVITPVTPVCKARDALFTDIIRPADQPTEMDLSPGQQTTAVEPRFHFPFLAASLASQIEPVNNMDFDRLDQNLNELVEKAWNEINIGESHTCTDCGKQYSTSSNLARHRQTHRSVNDKKARKCPHCEKIYVSMPAYSMHVRTHSQGCVCSFCGKRFSRPWLLQGHIRTHTGEKPFKCPKCGKAFADKSNLRAHIQTHSTEKPYTCGRCGKAFALKSYLYKHEESSCMRGQRFHRSQRSI